MKIRMNDDLLNISETIETLMEETRRGTRDFMWTCLSAKERIDKDKRIPAWVRVADMVKATLAVDTMEDMYDAYRWFSTTDYFRILKIDY